MGWREKRSLYVPKGFEGCCVYVLFCVYVSLSPRLVSFDASLLVVNTHNLLFFIQGASHSNNPLAVVFGSGGVGLFDKTNPARDCVLGCSTFSRTSRERRLVRGAVA